MTKRRVGFWAFVLVAVTVLAVVLSTGAVASPPSTKGDPNEVVSHALTSMEMLTAEDMANAIPAPRPEAVGGPVVPAADPAGVEFRASGPVVVPGGFANMPQKEWYGAEPAYLPVNPHYTYPPPYDRYLAAFWLYPQYPQRAIGKIFFKYPGSSSWYVCSGGVAAGRAVWTAGHCVYNNNLLPGPNGWANNVWFCPYRRDGITPLGCYTASNTATSGGWISNMSQYDIGIIITNDKAGRKIAWDTGYLCAIFYASPVQHWTDFGYPAAAPFAGERQYVCSASLAWQDARWGTPWTNAIGCDMTGGSSGGPWLLRYQPGAGGYVNCANGVNSYGYTTPAHPQVMYSSYFGQAAANLYYWGRVQ